MGYRIISPPNSFVQFDSPAGMDHCIWGDMSQCLPILQDTDIKFQFVIEANTVGEADALCTLNDDAITMGLVKDCGQASLDITFGGLAERFRISDLQVLYNWDAGLVGAVGFYDLKTCFKIAIEIDGGRHCSNCFQRITEACFSSTLEYSNDEDGYGFWYCIGATNKVRLPIYLTAPQTPIEKTQFRLANGVTKTLSAIVRKTFVVKGDMMDDGMLQKLAIAVVHDNVNVESARYTGGIALNSEFGIEYQDFLDFPLGIPQFTVEATPFFATNNNCQTCEEVTQLDLHDDDLGSVAEGETRTFNVYTNDTICCSPIVAEIVYINSAYLVSLTLNPLTGDVTLVAKNPAPLGHDQNLGRYRITCPDGGFKEANITGDIAGTAPSCEVPGTPVVGSVDPDAGTATVTFTASPSTPADGYDWALYKCEDLTTPVQSGNVAASPILLSSLSPGQCYRIVLASVCSQDIFYSAPVEAEFTVGAPATNCSSFTLENGDPTGPNPILRVTYMDCNGALQNLSVRSAVTICALVDSSGNMIYLVVDNPGLIITLNGPC